MSARSGLKRVAACAAVVASACGDDLGPCDQSAAQKLVYGRNDLAVTTGQALAHDSCGNGVFCHSSKATGDNRVGAPHGLDFDMIPFPRGWDALREHAEDAWAAVEDGTMPPRGVGSTKVGSGDWTYDPARAGDAARLPSIYTAEGKELFRNWLACDMPTVADTTLDRAGSGGAGGGGGAGEDDGGAQPPGPEDWGAIYADIIQPSCALGACHDDRSGAGVLKMGDACGAYRALLESGPCRKPRLVPGDESSFLIEKISDETPSCGFRMPSTGRLDAADIARIRAWIAGGALAEGCE